MVGANIASNGQGLNPTQLNNSPYTHSMTPNQTLLKQK